MIAEQLKGFFAFNFDTAICDYKKLENVEGVGINIETIRQQLDTARGPTWTMDHCRARLHFVRDHFNWVEVDWERVLITYESRFCLNTSDRGVHAFRLPNERYAQCKYQHIRWRLNYGVESNFFNSTYQLGGDK